MRVILDTHIALWVFSADKRVDPIQNLILSEETEVFVSVASLWELAIKIGLGKIEADLGEIRWAIVESGFTELMVKGAHTEALLQLPPYHKDPFDRMLIAQSITNKYPIMTDDDKIKLYGCQIV